MFTCEINGAYNGWRVNGTSLSALPPEIRGDLIRFTKIVGDNDLITLTIPGKAVYNGTTIQCITGVIGSSDEVESKNATLIIQGNHAILQTTNITIFNGLCSLLSAFHSFLICTRYGSKLLSSYHDLFEGIIILYRAAVPSSKSGDSQ